MAGLADPRVEELHVYNGPIEGNNEDSEEIILTEEDYELVQPEAEIVATPKFFINKATLDTISFSENKWKILVSGQSKSRTVIIEDGDFLSKVFSGKKVGKGDVFTFRIREDKTTKNGRTKTTWTAVEIKEGSTHTADGSASEG
ncbi:hypothetical protein [Corynebacterium lowii]|uniref:Uncharacterized protein n=1 Tax=Corynebacterium lowii TaxID=1544413 RepID=A0A0Q0Z5L2_9CORY|nr:hypothetical protein [Corynebacterium lowii]KQB84787.1 hypothetical protein Clow_02046 [Corynebacterium lowii]MDP9851690.1 hypothetical protein [Corynebacterium lowii]